MSFCCDEVAAQSLIESDLIHLTELTLKNSPSIKQNGLAINKAEANRQMQTSAFDHLLVSGLSFNHNQLNLFNQDPRNEIFEGPLKTNYAELSSGLQRRYRSGLLVNLNLVHTQSADNFPLNRFNEKVGRYYANHNTATTLSLTQPILRGRGRKNATAAEKAAGIYIEGARYEYLLNASQEVLQMGIAYWQYRNAFERLNIFEENEKRVRNVLEITEQLVNADKKPTSDLIQIKADLADQERQTTIARQNLHNIKVNLGRTIGLTAEESMQLSVPMNRFPPLEGSGYQRAVDVNAFIEIARKNRSDILANQKTKEALELELGFAKNTLTPQLDLTGFLTYGGMAMGRGLNVMFAPSANREGRDVTSGLKLSLSFPINNNQAKANYAQRRILLDGQMIANQNLIRNIDLNVSIALNNLSSSVLILQKAQESLTYSQEVFKNEQIKFQNGLTTLLNVILFQERLTLSELEYIQAQQQFAISIMNLRFETGTLLSPSEDAMSPSIDSETYYRLPTLK
jgi:outer membrane protein TolC